MYGLAPLGEKKLRDGAGAVLTELVYDLSVPEGENCRKGRYRVLCCDVGQLLGVDCDEIDRRLLGLGDPGK